MVKFQGRTSRSRENVVCHAICGSREFIDDMTELLPGRGIAENPLAGWAG
jgi:hypothetical protein